MQADEVLFIVERRRIHHPRTVRYIGSRVTKTESRIPTKIPTADWFTYIFIYNRRTKETLYIGYLCKENFTNSMFSMDPIRIKLTQLDKLPAIANLVQSHATQLIDEGIQPLPF